MSDMSKFKVGANTYNIKDAKSRGVSLTWAQYQALSYEEQHNGTAYYITDRDAIYPVDHELNANSSNAVANDVVTPHILAMENVLGAKNLLPTGESGTYSGLTFTVNADGSITISGTASDNVYYTVACPKLYAGDYILTGYPSSAMGMNCSLYYDGVPGSDTGDGQPFTLSQYVDNKNVYIFVLGGTNFTTPVTFKPMIRPAGTDPTYVPYAMTNSELTDAVVKYIDTEPMLLSELTWYALQNGKYYALFVLYDIPDNSKVLSMAMLDFDYLSQNDTIQPYIRGTSDLRVGLMANNNQYNENAYIRLRIAYI